MKKIFYNRKTIRGVRISRLAKVPPIYHNWLGSLNEKRVNYLSSIEGKGGKKELCCMKPNQAEIDILK